MVTLFELGVDFKFERIELSKGEHKVLTLISTHSSRVITNPQLQSADFKSKHPFGVVPYLQDGSFGLFESGAITKYIVAKHAAAGSQFQEPTHDVEAMALYEQAMRVEDNYFDPNVSAIAFERMFKG